MVGNLAKVQVDRGQCTHLHTSDGDDDDDDDDDVLKVFFLLIFGKWITLLHNPKMGSSPLAQLCFKKLLPNF